MNCGRGASLSQLDVRGSKAVRFGGCVSSSAVFTGTFANHTPNSVFMKPNAFAGDDGQAEQHVRQVGFRVTF